MQYTSLGGQGPRSLEQYLSPLEFINVSHLHTSITKTFLAKVSLTFKNQFMDPNQSYIFSQSLYSILPACVQSST